MKVIQINGWLGAHTSKLIDLINSEGPDFVCMQEVLNSDVPNPLWERYTMLKDISTGCGMESFFAPTFGFESMGEKVQLGNALFAKHSGGTQNIVFTHGSYIDNQVAQNYNRNIRNLQIVTFDNLGLTIANHHGYHEPNPMGSDTSKRSIQTVADTLAGVKQPLIVCGDLNLQPASPALILLDNVGLRNHTAEAGLANTLSPLHKNKGLEVACDYIFTSADVNALQFKRLDKLASDHMALVLEFDLEQKT